MRNILAASTIRYIWSHPNCKNQKVESLIRFIGWQLYKRLFRKCIDFQLIPGVQIRCYPDSYSASAALYCGLYDYHEMNFLLRYLRTGDSFLDVGANIGIYTLLASSIIQKGKIYSFEVLSKNFKRLKENLELNHFKQVEAYEIAISDQTGQISLNLAEEDSMPFISLKPTAKTITVPTNTLGGALSGQPIENITLGKMDIEGAEILALKGASQLLSQGKPTVWIIEIGQPVRNFGHSKQDVVDVLSSYGYGLYTYDADKNKIYPVTLERQKSNNFLAISDAKIDTVCDRLNEWNGH